jgi:hypothetical protein
VTTYKSIRNLNACVEIREEEGEIEEERVGKVCIYWLLPMESPTATSRRYTHW